MTTSPINFQHRIPWSNDDRKRTFHIEDAIHSPMLRAIAIAELLETAASWDAENLNAAVVGAAAEAIRLELTDALLFAKTCSDQSVNDTGTGNRRD
ncbi:hypothetical protein CWO84_04805 [Methylomonas sp. Kb3]|uniref:hypothetical protein n=1 Tax=Methylomonas sp. Kb3 TaxID=1611544 RepID=UPI000C334492|nr:hypothetical protein [Methylomonas sp. Kb3]PKD41455.1 hypothetical protein CWO84_04805 [Methylomonas sp. Kb3]